jgi:hypothetical protein
LFLTDTKAAAVPKSQPSWPTEPSGLFATLHIPWRGTPANDECSPTAPGSDVAKAFDA